MVGPFLSVAYYRHSGYITRQIQSAVVIGEANKENPYSQTLKHDMHADCWTSAFWGNHFIIGFYSGQPI